MGITETYPRWFREEVMDNIFMDSNRFTFWTFEEERSFDYYEKELVEVYSVFLRKPDGDLKLTDYDTFEKLYRTLTYEDFSNSGIAAFEEDCIEYVECQPGVLSSEYPDWFYEYFTESIHLPNEETIFIFDTYSATTPISSHNLNSNVIEHLNEEIGQVSIDHHCVFLRNYLGEIRHMRYEDFEKFYNSNENLKEGVIV